MRLRPLAMEWGPSGVRSNAVTPGMIFTAVSEDIYRRPGVREAREALIPGRRIGPPEDIAEAMRFPASDRSDHVNGAESTVDRTLARDVPGLVPRAASDPVRSS